MFKLIMGSKSTSSWSLRPYLALKMLQEPFEEQVIAMYQPETASQIAEVSPSGKVPVLVDGHLRIWDSLAICEYLAECFPKAKLWPEDAKERALARALSAEMHAGFTAMRNQLSFYTKGHKECPTLDEDCRKDIQRIEAIWTNNRRRFSARGEFLFGNFGIVDAMFAPVACRFDTYGIKLNPDAQSYANTLLNLPAVQEWYKAAASE